MNVLLALLLGVPPAFFYAIFIYWLDRYEKEPLLLVGAVFLWGAVVATGGAFIINTIFGVSVYLFTGSEELTEIATGSVSAPLVEESLKGLAVLIVFLIFRKEFDSLLDGVVYAAVAALGFAATENSFYIYNYGTSTGGIAEIAFIAFIRNVVVGWQHPFYTAFIGIGLALARTNRNTLLKFIFPLAGWGLAVFTHSFHNTMAVFISDFGGFFLTSLVDWSGWFFMFGLIIFFISREQKFLRQYLQEEVDLGNITAAQFKTACSSLAASKARFSALTSGKYAPTNKFYQQCAELAHKKAQLAKLGEQKAAPEIEKIRALMAQLAPNALT